MKVKCKVNVNLCLNKKKPINGLLAYYFKHHLTEKRHNTPSISLVGKQNTQEHWVQCRWEVVRLTAEWVYAPWGQGVLRLGRFLFCVLSQSWNFSSALLLRSISSASLSAASSFWQNNYQRISQEDIYSQLIYITFKWEVMSAITFPLCS